MQHYDSIKSIIVQIAAEKCNYYNILKDEIAAKIKPKKEMAKIYKEKYNEKYTFYISLKR